jgi:glycosyltransferase involved in cell wall biosynthesis
MGDTSAVMSPGKMFEYMASERLIVSSDLPVIREVLNDSNAVLCAPEDVDAWENALRRAQSDGQWSAALAKKARADVEKYTWRRRVRHVLGTLMGQPK